MVTAVAELPDWADPGDKQNTGELVGKAVDPTAWAEFLGRISDGITLPQAIAEAPFTHYALKGILRSDKQAMEQYQQARLNACWKNWDYDTIDEIMVALMTNEQGGALKKILEDRGLDSSSFYQLMTRDPQVKEMYEEARQVQAEIQADEMQAIADYGLNDTYTDDKGRQRVDQDVVQRSRLRVDTLKWRLSKLHWKRFGDKLQTEENVNMVIDHAERLESGRKRLEELNAKRAGVKSKRG